MLISEQLTEKIIGAAIDVHRALGPGLLESVYEECFCHELRLRGLTFRRQVAVPIHYKGVNLDCGYKLDVVVEESVIVEVKSVEMLTGIHEAQLLTYMKITNIPVGLLINFNVAVLTRGIKRKALKEVLAAAVSSN